MSRHTTSGARSVFTSSDSSSTMDHDGPEADWTSRQFALSSGPFFAPAGQPDGEAEGLENTTDNFSAPRRVKGESKWTKLDWLRVESSINRQRSCMARPLGKSGVSIRVTDGAAGVSGVVRCGRICCPNCGPRIGAQRREDIEHAVNLWRLTGARVLMLTLTLRHNRRQPFEQLVKAMSKTWNAAVGGRGWARDRKDYGIAGTVRVWEEKWSVENGWHTHVHALVFLNAEEQGSLPIKGLLASMFDRWARKAVSLGLDAPLLKGQDLHEVTGDQAGKNLGGYFAKQAEGTEDLAAQAMGWEMSNPSGKSRGDSFTPAEILEYAMGGDDQMHVLWYEYEKGMVGRRTIAWSKGLRDLLGLDAEMTDQDAAEQETSSVEDTVLTMTNASWLKLARHPGARFEALRLAAADVGAALEWLRQMGCIAKPGIYDFEAEAAE